MQRQVFELSEREFFGVDTGEKRGKILKLHNKFFKALYYIFLCPATPKEFCLQNLGDRLQFKETVSRDF